MENKVKVYLKFYYTNKHFYTQIIMNGKIVLSSSTLDSRIKEQIDTKSKSVNQITSVIAQDIIKKLNDGGYDTLYLCKNKYKYHGKIKYFLDFFKEQQILLH